MTFPFSLSKSFIVTKNFMGIAMRWRTFALVLLAAICEPLAPSFALQVIFSSIPNLDVEPDSVYCAEYSCFAFGKFYYPNTPGIVVQYVQFAVPTPSYPITSSGFYLSPDNNGEPGQILFSEGAYVTSSKETPFGTTIITIPFLDQLDLQAGYYWIGLFGSPTLGYSGESGDLLYTTNIDPYTFVSTGETAAFAILGGAPAPEPSTWAMMALGFAGLGFLGWRGWRKTGPSKYREPCDQKKWPSWLLCGVIFNYSSPVLMISEGSIQDLCDPDREEQPVLLLHPTPQIDERQMPCTLPN
jgi:hypothetical protein